jgi:outer membrane protein, multidrug efflux system
VVIEDEPERLMWLLLADLNVAGGARRSASTAVLQATCVDATVIPHLEQRLNFSLFSWPSKLWAVGLSISLPLFDGGQRRGNLNAAKAAYEETLARYRHTVLRAFAEVEDNLAAQRLLAEEYELQVVAWESARRQVELATNRYRGGLSSYLPVMVAQNAALERERTVVRLRGQRFAACVALVKSLGGGWHE